MTHHSLFPFAVQAADYRQPTIQFCSSGGQSAVAFDLVSVKE